MSFVILQLLARYLIGDKMSRIYTRTARRRNITGETTEFIGRLSPTGKGVVRQDKMVRTFIRLYTKVVAIDRPWAETIVILRNKKDGYIRKAIKDITRFLALRSKS